MHPRITGLAKGIIALGLIVSLGSRFDAAAKQDDDQDDLFPRHSRPQSGQTGLDAHDPYAPGPLGETTTPDNAAVRFEAVLGVSLQDPRTPDDRGARCRPGICDAW